MSAEIKRARRDLDAAAARLIEEGLAAWGGEDSQRALIVRGQANLLGDPARPPISSACGCCSTIWNRRSN